MHQVLHIPEILLDVFGYVSAERRSNSVHLAELARTCRTFKEPALDVLWEKLYELSPLVRCLPEAYHLVEPGGKQQNYSCHKPCYTLSRPLKEAELVTLRGYTRRVRSIRGSFAKITEETIRVIFSLVPFDDPLFPHLQSLYWVGPVTFPLLPIAVPSLKVLYLCLPSLQRPTGQEYFNVFGDHCPHVESLVVGYHSFGPEDSTVSNLVCHWSKLQRVACSNVTLSMDAISHLVSVSGLKSLEFKAGNSLIQDTSHLNSKLLFSSLIYLETTSESLDAITSLLRYIRLPAIETLSVIAEGYISRRAIQPYWAAVLEACPSNVLTWLKIRSSLEESEGEIPLGEEPLPCLTLDDLRPCKVFAGLCGLNVDIPCLVNLTDADILELVSPHMESFLINYERGWKIHAGGGGITLSGLVQLLRKCPSLSNLCLAIDTRTFTEIPEGLDVSFPAREYLEINLMDSYILSEFVPGLVSVFITLGLDPSQMITSFDFGSRENELWTRVLESWIH